MKNFDIAMALLTSIGAFYVSMNFMLFFLVIFKQTKAYFKWIMLSVALAKFALGGWALTNAMFMLFYDSVRQPIYTLPWRLMILTVIIIQVWLVYKINEDKEIGHEAE
jgi:hypothetical protein